MISAGVVVLILWLIIGLLLVWNVYQSRVIDRLKRLNDFEKQRKQETSNNNPQSRIN